MDSGLSNKPFPDKKGDKSIQGYCFEKSLLLEEREIAEKWDDWTVTTINERRAMLLRWAKERWRVDFSNISGDMNDPDDESGDEGVAP